MQNDFEMTKAQRAIISASPDEWLSTLRELEAKSRVGFAKLQGLALSSEEVMSCYYAAYYHFTMHCTFEDFHAFTALRRSNEVAQDMIELAHKDSQLSEAIRFALFQRAR